MFNPGAQAPEISGNFSILHVVVRQDLRFALYISNFLSAVTPHYL
jgi:hypothetical protein